MSDSKAGVKFDAEKIDPSFVLEYFPRALLAVAAVAEYGARKYTRGGWKSVPNAVARYSAAKVRHQLAPYIEGPYDDSDSGMAHLAQETWNALAKLEKAIEAGEIEVRRGNDLKEGKPVLGTARKIPLEAVAYEPMSQPGAITPINADGTERRAGVPVRP